MTKSEESVIRAYLSAESPYARFEALRKLGLVRFSFLWGVLLLVSSSFMLLGTWWLSDVSPRASSEVLRIFVSVILEFGVFGTVAGAVVWLIGERVARSKRLRE